MEQKTADSKFDAEDDLRKPEGPDGRSDMILDLFSSAERQTILDTPETREALSVLVEFSPALTRGLSVRPAEARRLFLDRAFEKPSDPTGLPSQLSALAAGVENMAELQAVLRVFRLRVMSRLAVRDLTGRADLKEVTAGLSALADACLEKALEKALDWTAARHDLRADELGLKPIVLGMGKLGGRELNYSSDIDLIYLFEPGQDKPADLSPEKAADEVFNLVTRALAEMTSDGVVFRVDLDLRPGGKDGALAPSVDKARNHYLVLGQPWERMALLKARTAAGDREAGRRFLADVNPFIFRRHLDYTSLEELRELKQRFSREKKAKIRKAVRAGRAGGRLDVKLSPGGIREIEFFAQALTLTFGGRLPHLRRPATLDALELLAAEGLIKPEDQKELSRAYIFLRTVEHRLQLRELTQTQVLPRSPDSRLSLARSLGFETDPWSELTAALEKHMGLVRERFELLLSEPGDQASGSDAPDPAAKWIDRLLDNLDDDHTALEALTEAGFSRPESALSVCRNIREQKFLPEPLARYSSRLERLMPLMLRETASTPDPDRAVLHLERFLASIGPRAGFLVLLEENPQLVRLLSIIFAAGDYLPGILISHPGILESLIDRRSACADKDLARLEDELQTMLGAEDDPENRLGIIRRFKNDETLRIGLHDLLAKIDQRKIQSQLSDLAEAVIDRTMDLAARLAAPGWDHDRAPYPLAVIGLGKLGGRELSYGSDLDLIFVMDDAALEEGLKMEEAVRLTQRFISYLSVHLDAGPGYEIDSRLRPSGRSGPLVVTPSSFDKYHRTSMLWERQALLKLRAVHGPPDLCRQVTDLAFQAVFDRDPPEDAAAKIDSLRRQMSIERGRLKPGTINLKFSPGGLVDAEFLTQYLQLIHGRSGPENLRSPSTLTALEALSEAGLGPPGLARVGPAYEHLSRVSGRLRLIHARSGDRAAFLPEEIEAADLPAPPPSLGLADGNALETVEHCLGLVKDAYELVFQKKDGGSGE